ncbi:MAG: pyridoxamine 5'-phosphate oxidase family protein [Pseudomonadota bacterium]
MNAQHSPSPWHQGERDMHARIGAAAEMEALGRRVIRPFMPGHHSAFYATLPFLVGGIVDAEGNPWATFLNGDVGFAQAPSATQLDLATALDPSDPARAGFATGQPIGLLGIELQTRRRNRANGRISAFSGNRISVEITQTMGNCQKYIQTRAPDTVDPVHLLDSATDPLNYAATSDEFHKAVTNADTFFVASYAVVDGERQVDVSHRGGTPGFIAIDQDGTLTVPDYPGNRFFNTLGNISQTHRAGLLIPDFETGMTLQLTGHAELVTDPEAHLRFKGAERAWRVKPTHIILRRAALANNWSLRERSPFNP